MQVYAITDAGRQRPENQDAVYLGPAGKYPTVLMVADGMGGYAGGSLASRRTIEYVLEALDAPTEAEDPLRAAVEFANLRILEIAHNVPAYRNMGSTLTLAAVSGDGVEVAQVGDSRAYLLHNGTLRQITTDHSYVQFLVDRGRMTREEARHNNYRNRITRALGMQGLQVDRFRADFLPGDILLVCSDGLSMYFSDKELECCLARPENAEQKAKSLLQLTLERGGSDNVSIALAMREEADAHAEF